MSRALPMTVRAYTADGEKKLITVKARGHHAALRKVFRSCTDYVRVETLDGHRKLRRAGWA